MNTTQQTFTSLKSLQTPMHVVSLRETPAHDDTVKQVLSPGTNSASTSAIESKQAGNQHREHSVTVCSNYFRIKDTVDRAITAVLMVVALPVILVVSLIVLLVDGRPVFYRQVRVGKQGRLFRIWKFRSMKKDAEKATGAVWSNAADPRVTRLGHWLRCSHLDELPQVFNVLSGDMNLVGPRPERPEFVRELSQELPEYNSRTLVRPGITGLSQLRWGYDHSVVGVRKKVSGDLRYIRDASFWGDVRLLASTLPYIARQLYRRFAEKDLAKNRVDDKISEIATNPVSVNLRIDRAANRGGQNQDSRIHFPLERRA